MSTDLPPRKAAVELQIFLDDTVAFRVKAASEEEIKNRASPLLQEAGADRATAEEFSAFLEDIRDPVTLGSLLAREAEALDASDPETALKASQLKLIALLVRQRFQEALKVNEEAIDLASDQKSSSVRPGETPGEATVRVSRTAFQISLSVDLMTLPDLYATKACLLQQLQQCS